jgi:hypothetical protein
LQNKYFCIGDHFFVSYLLGQNAASSSNTIVGLSTLGLYMQKEIFAENKRTSILRSVCIALLIIAGNNEEAMSQLGSKSQEIWPSIDAFYKINPKLRLYGTIGGTKLDESSYTDGAIGIFMDNFIFPFTDILRHNHAEGLPGKFLWLRTGIQYTASPPSLEDPFREIVVVTEANYRFYLPFDILLTNKNRFDWRVNNGDFNVRYRPKLMLDKDLHTEYLTFTVNAFLEYFANFGNSQVNRLRAQFGVEIKVLKHVNYEVFWNHQFANQPEIQRVNAFGMCLKIYMEKGEKSDKKKIKK